MPLQNTIVLAGNAQDRAAFRELLESPYLLLVVLGNQPETTRFVNVADLEASSTNAAFRRIVWAQNPNHILLDVLGLANTSGGPINETTLAVSVSANNQVRYIIPISALNVDEGEMRGEVFTAFLNAGG